MLPRYPSLNAHPKEEEKAHRLRYLSLRIVENEVLEIPWILKIFPPSTQQRSNAACSKVR